MGVSRRRGSDAWRSAASGRLDEAHALLEEAAHQILSEEAERGLAAAQACVDTIRELGGRLPSDDVTSRIQALTIKEPSRRVRVRSSELRGIVLFVGGNETQQRYDERVRKELAATHPGVTVDFAHTGWGSNWGRELVSIESRVRNADVVVVMQFVRTLLGRHVRTLCGKHGRPWVACTGHGHASIRRSIEAAAALLAEEAV